MKAILLTFFIASISACSSFSEKEDSRTMASDPNGNQTYLVCHDSSNPDGTLFKMTYVPTPVSADVPASQPAAQKKSQEGQITILVHGSQLTYAAKAERRQFTMSMSAVGFDHFMNAISPPAISTSKNVMTPNDVRVSLVQGEGYVAQLSIKFANPANNLSFDCNTN